MYFCLAMEKEMAYDVAPGFACGVVVWRMNKTCVALLNETEILLM